jgi:hypothetical protein
MKKRLFRWLALCAALFAATLLTAASASARVEGRVQGGGGPIAKATVTLWAAGPSTPRKLAETQTKDDGSFALRVDGKNTRGDVLYLISKGGEPMAGGSKGPNPAIALMATLGTTPPKRVTINELTGWHRH